MNANEDLKSLFARKSNAGYAKILILGSRVRNTVGVARYTSAMHGYRLGLDVCTLWLIQEN